jgi:hypothetical protein
VNGVPVNTNHLYSSTFLNRIQKDNIFSGLTIANVGGDGFLGGSGGWISQIRMCQGALYTPGATFATDYTKPIKQHPNDVFYLANGFQNKTLRNLGSASFTPNNGVTTNLNRNTATAYGSAS